jgi:hypothetical protein
MEKRPQDPVQAAKLASEAGVMIRGSILSSHIGKITRKTTYTTKPLGDS